MAQKAVAPANKPAPTAKPKEAVKQETKTTERPATKPQPAPAHNHSEKAPAERPASSSRPSKPERSEAAVSKPQQSPAYDHNEKEPADRPASSSRPSKPARPDAALTKPKKEKTKVNNTAKAPAEEEKATIAKPPMSTVEEEKENTTTPQPKPPLPPAPQHAPQPVKPTMTHDDYCTWADNHHYLFPSNVWLSPSYLSCRSNAGWYGWWYYESDNNCNWAGDVTIVNSTGYTIDLYTEQHEAADIPTINAEVASSVAINALYTPLQILPNDSLTFKMPCGALKYEAQEKVLDGTVAKRNIGWVRTVSYDVRVEIKEEDMK
jgi:hypothetical protein